MTAETPESPEADMKMTIWEHLQELRSRLIRSALAVLVTTICSWVFRKQILAWLLRPYEKAWIIQMPNEPLMTS